ncbi:MAG: PEP-CTERM sorting domain-containing protein [Candidatus Didemnitutus sp.]|nr:PEP-CTERM sorting domain-containing protein [Candidatus Didemnitutus sp.]
MTNTPRSFVCTVLLAGCALVSAHAQSVYEPFSYVNGDPLPGKILGGSYTWGFQNSGTDVTIASGNLSVTGLAASTGSSASLPGGNFKEAVLPFTTTPVSSGTIFYSFAFKLSSLPTATTYSFGLNSNTNFASTIWLQASGGGYQIGLSNRSNSTPAYDSTVFATGTTVFIVGSYEFVSGTANDVSKLWINPASATFDDLAVPSAALTSTGGTDMTSINSFLIRGASGSPAGTFDELRIGTTWASVTPVPEPSTYAAILGALALAGVVLRRRSRLA